LTEEDHLWALFEAQPRATLFDDLLATEVYAHVRHDEGADLFAGVAVLERDGQADAQAGNLQECDLNLKCGDAHPITTNTLIQQSIVYWISGYGTMTRAARPHCASPSASKTPSAP